jgi:hypothetical protein
MKHAKKASLAFKKGKFTIICTISANDCKQFFCNKTKNIKARKNQN